MFSERTYAVHSPEDQDPSMKAVEPADAALSGIVLAEE